MLELTAWILLGSAVAGFLLDAIDQLVTDFTLARRNKLPLRLLGGTCKTIAFNMLYVLFLGLLIIPTIWRAKIFGYKLFTWLWTGKWVTTL